MSGGRNGALQSAIDKLARYGPARDRGRDHAPRQVVLTDDEAVALLERLRADPQHALTLTLSSQQMAAVTGLVLDAAQGRGGWSPAAVSRILAAITGWPGIYREPAGGYRFRLELTAYEWDVLRGILARAVEHAERDGTQDSPVATRAAQLLPIVDGHCAAIADSGAHRQVLAAQRIGG